MAADELVKSQNPNLEEGEIASPKHPLERSWTWWFDNLSSNKKPVVWGTTLRSVYTFSTVEDFWCLYNNVLQPSQLLPGIDFHCFKQGIEPKWEDPKCAHGGKWSINMPRGGPKSLLDTFWLNTILAMIGEQFDEGDELCGAVVSIRGKHEKLALWTKTASNEEAQISIGRQWKEMLDFHEKIHYIVHEDAKRDKLKNRYSV